MKKDNVEIFDEETTVTLYDDDKNPVDFYEIACVELDGKFYELLQPTEPMEGLGEDEALIFELKEGNDDDEDLFVPIDSEELLDNVFAEYVKAVTDLEGGCGCCDCECDCDDDDCDDEHDDCHCDHCHDHKNS